MALYNSPLKQAKTHKWHPVHELLGLKTSNWRSAKCRDGINAKYVTRLVIP